MRQKENVWSAADLTLVDSNFEKNSEEIPEVLRATLCSPFYAFTVISAGIVLTETRLHRSFVVGLLSASGRHPICEWAKLSCHTVLSSTSMRQTQKSTNTWKQLITSYGDVSEKVGLHRELQ